MLGKICIENHRIMCVIGVNPEERETLQEIVVSLELRFDFSKCVTTDSLEDTIDYDAIFSLCKEVAMQGRFKLLETLACKMLEALYAHFPVLQAKIRVFKPKANAAIEMER